MKLSSSQNLLSTPVYDKLWWFATERQKIFFDRIAGKCPPFSLDPIISKHHFTNAYRASDRVSQYLINQVIYSTDLSAEDVIFRILLFKTFNKIETWQLLENKLGKITARGFSSNRYAHVLSEARIADKKIYSAAYILPSGKSAFGSSKKHENHLALISKMMQSGITGKIEKCKSLKELYELLLSYPTIGPFLAFQYAIDINYSEIVNFSEMSFVVAGPGAKNGIQKCFVSDGDLDLESIIRIVTERQEEEFKKRSLDFKNLWGRKLQLIDVQNLFCEIDKYARVAMPQFTTGDGRHRIKRLFAPKTVPIQYDYPPKWGINPNRA